MAGYSMITRKMDGKIEMTAKAEAQAPAGEAEEKAVFVVREDGGIARLEFEAEAGDDLWTALERAFPRACELMDEASVLPSDAEHDWDEKFGQGEDWSLRGWLGEWDAQVVRVDGHRVEVLKEVCGWPSKEAAVGKAVEWLELHGVDPGVDEGEQDLRVRVGGEDVWSWLEAIQEGE